MIVINPQNKVKTAFHVVETGITESYFDYSVSGNIVTFFSVYAVINFIFPMLSSFLIDFEGLEEIKNEESLLSDQKSAIDPETKDKLIKRSIYSARSVAFIQSSFIGTISKCIELQINQ
jgi:hypothetical protein